MQEEYEIEVRESLPWQKCLKCCFVQVLGENVPCVPYIGRRSTSLMSVSHQELKCIFRLKLWIGLNKASWSSLDALKFV